MLVELPIDLLGRTTWDEVACHDNLILKAIGAGDHVVEMPMAVFVDSIAPVPRARGQNTQPRWKFFGQSSFEGTNDRELGRPWLKSVRDRAESAKMSMGVSTVAHTVDDAVILRRNNS